jgi:hypothetical protein
MPVKDSRLNKLIKGHMHHIDAEAGILRFGHMHHIDAEAGILRFEKRRK